MATDYAEIARIAQERAKVEAPKILGSDRELIRDMWEMPAVRQFFTTFKQAVGIGNIFSSEELEIALTSPADVGNTLLHELHVKLIRGLFPNVSKDRIMQLTWQNYLKKYLNQNGLPMSENSPETTDYNLLSYVDRVKLLFKLCQERAEYEDLRDKMRENEDELLDRLRELPLGYDAMGNMYWHFDNDIRLYKQMKGTHGKGRKDPGFTLIATTIEEWQKVCDSFSKSTNSDEVALYKVLKEEVLPSVTVGIESATRNKERRIVWDIMPRRRSDRVATKIVEDEKAEEKLKKEKEEIKRIAEDKRARAKRRHEKYRRISAHLEQVRVPIPTVQENEEEEEEEIELVQEVDDEKPVTTRKSQPLPLPPPLQPRKKTIQTGPLQPFVPKRVNPTVVVKLRGESMDWVFSHYPSMPHPETSPATWATLLNKKNSRRVEYARRSCLWPNPEISYDELVANVVAEHQGAILAKKLGEDVERRRVQEAKEVKRKARIEKHRKEYAKTHPQPQAVSTQQQAAGMQYYQPQMWGGQYGYYGGAGGEQYYAGGDAAYLQQAQLQQYYASMGAAGGSSDIAAQQQYYSMSDAAAIQQVQHQAQQQYYSTVTAIRSSGSDAVSQQQALDQAQQQYVAAVTAARSGGDSTTQQASGGGDSAAEQQAQQQYYSAVTAIRSSGSDAASQQQALALAQQQYYATISAAAGDSAAQQASGGGDSVAIQQAQQQYVATVTAARSGGGDSQQQEQVVQPAAGASDSDPRQTQQVEHTVTADGDPATQQQAEQPTQPVSDSAAEPQAQEGSSSNDNDPPAQNEAQQAVNSNSSGADTTTQREHDDTAVQQPASSQYTSADPSQQQVYNYTQQPGATGATVQYVQQNADGTYTPISAEAIGQYQAAYMGQQFGYPYGDQAMYQQYYQQQQQQQ